MKKKNMPQIIVASTTKSDAVIIKENSFKFPSIEVFVTPDKTVIRKYKP